MAPRQSMGVGATAARVHGLTGVEGDVGRTWAAAESSWYVVEVAALGLGRPREPGPCAEGAASLNTGLADARAVVGAIRNLGLGEAGRVRGTALAGRAAAVRRTVRGEDGCGVLADVAAGAAVLGIGRGVGAGPATAAAGARATGASGCGSSGSCGARAGGTRGARATGTTFARTGGSSASRGASHSCTTGRASRAAEAHAGVRRAGEAGVTGRVAEARASFGALRAACWTGTAACRGSHHGRNSNRQEPCTAPMHSFPRITFSCSAGTRKSEQAAATFSTETKLRVECRVQLRESYPAPSSDAFGNIIRFCGGAGSRTLGTQTRNFQASRGFATETAELARVRLFRLAPFCSAQDRRNPSRLTTG